MPYGQEVNNTTESESTLHPFERAGLGKAPFRFVGFEAQDLCYGQAILNREEYQRTGILVTTAPGGSCAFCGTYIVQMCRIGSADGKRFHVGTDCVAKAGGTRVAAAVKVAKLRTERSKRAEKATAVSTELTALLADDSVRTVLVNWPHPNDASAKRGASLLDYATWMIRCSGAAGRAKTLKAVKAVIAVKAGK